MNGLFVANSGSFCYNADILSKENNVSEADPISGHEMENSLKKITTQDNKIFSILKGVRYQGLGAGVGKLAPLINRIDTQGGRRFCPASLKQKWQMKWSAKGTPVSRGFC